MYLLIAAVAAFVAFFVIVLPAGVLCAALLLALRSRKAEVPDARLCRASDATDPSAKPCHTEATEAFCEHHRELELAG